MAVQSGDEVHGPDLEYSVSIRWSCEDDEWEDDDGPDRYRTYHLTGPPEQHRHCEDADWVAVYGRSDKVYRARTKNLQGGADTVLEVYLSDGQTRILENDDGGPEPLASELVARLPESGLYYVRVAAFGDWYGGPKSYELEIEELDCVDDDDCDEGEGCEGGYCVGDCRRDDSEDDDHWESAAGSQVGFFDCKTFCDDAEDWLVLELEADVPYDVHTFGLHPWTDTVVELYAAWDEEPVLLAEDDDGAFDRGASLIPDFVPDQNLYGVSTWYNIPRLSTYGKI